MNLQCHLYIDGILDLAQRIRVRIVQVVHDLHCYVSLLRHNPADQRLDYVWVWCFGCEGIGPVIFGHQAVAVLSSSIRTRAAYATATLKLCECTFLANVLGTSGWQ